MQSLASSASQDAYFHSNVISKKAREGLWTDMQAVAPSLPVVCNYAYLIKDKEYTFINQKCTQGHSIYNASVFSAQIFFCQICACTLITAEVLLLSLDSFSFEITGVR